MQCSRALTSAEGNAIYNWVMNGGKLLADIGWTIHVPGVAPFGVQTIEGQNGGSTGLSWYFHGAPMTDGPVTGPMGGVALFASSAMDHPVLSTPNNLITDCSKSGYPMIVHNQFNQGKVVIVFAHAWSHDLDWSTNAYRSTIFQANNLQFLQKVIQYFQTGTTTNTIAIGSVNPSSGVTINISPLDNYGQGNGSTQFTRTYNSGTGVSLTAPAVSPGNTFYSWLKNGSLFATAQQISVTISSNDNFTAVYTPTICLLAVNPSTRTVSQSGGTVAFTVSTTCNWTASSTQTWCTVTSSGAGNGTLTATCVQNTGVTTRTANISVAATGATTVTVTVTQPGSSQGPPNWTPTPNLQYVMSVIGKIQLATGGFSTNANDIIGAFVGTECRGVASPVPNLGGILFLSIGSNIQSGETVTFKIYLSISGEIKDANETMTFMNAYEFGTVPNPFIFTYGSVTPCTLTVSPPTRSVSAGGGAVSYTVSTTCSWTASSNQTWCTVTSSGTGNSTLTATCTQNTGVTTRTANISVASPGAATVVVTVTQAAPVSPPTWIPVPNLQYTMSVIGKIQLLTGSFSLNANDMVGAFVGSECRGVANPISNLGGILFLSIGSNAISGEQVNFRIYLAASGEIVNANEIITFQNAFELGTVPAPFIFTYGVPQNLNLQGFKIVNGETACYGAYQTITLAGGSSTFQVQSGGNTTLIAGQKVSMLPGTTVQSGGHLWAYITTSGIVTNQSL